MELNSCAPWHSIVVLGRSMNLTFNYRAWILQRTSQWLWASRYFVATLHDILQLPWDIPSTLMCYYFGTFPEHVTITLGHLRLFTLRILHIQYVVTSGTLPCEIPGHFTVPLRHSVRFKKYPAWLFTLVTWDVLRMLETVTMGRSFNTAASGVSMQFMF
jgi:hypothetical protein